MPAVTRATSKRSRTHRQVEGGLTLERKLFYVQLFDQIEGPRELAAEQTVQLGKSHKPAELF